MDGHIKILPLRFNLRLYNADNTVHHFPKGHHIQIQVHFPALNLGHIQYIIDKPQKMPAGKRDFLQAILHLGLVVYISCGNSRHSHNGIHGRPYVMAHAGKEFTLRLIGMLRTPARFFKLQNLLPGHM